MSAVGSLLAGADGVVRRSGVTCRRASRRWVVAVPLLVAAVGLSVVLATKHHRADVCMDSTVYEDVRRYSPSLIGSSPDGKFCLKRNKEGPTAQGESISVIEIESGRVVQTLSTEKAVLRLTWRPDSRAIAYFAQPSDRPGRQLMIWDLATGTQRRVAIPESNAQPIVRWAPDGSRLAFLSHGARMFVVNPVDSAVREFTEVVGFDWSSDSTQIALLLSTENGAARLAVVDVADGRTLRAHPVPEPERALEIAWQGSRDILIRTETAGLSGDGVCRLSIMQPGTGKRTLLRESPLNVREVAWCRRGQAVLWHQQEAEGLNKVVVWNRNAEPRALNTAGQLNFRTLLEDRQAIDAICYASHAHQLLRIGLDGKSTNLLAEQRGFDGPGVRHVTVMLETKDHARVPIYVSRAGRSPSKAAVIRMNGGTAISLAVERWTEIQLYTKRGIDFIHVENRLGYGAEDLLAACEYARKELGVPAGKLVVVGSSTAATVVLDAVVQDPGCAGIIALMGLTASPANSQPLREARPRLLYFHGGHDPYGSASDALEIVKAIFPSDPSRDVHHVFSGEGHWPQQDSSLAIFHSTIIHALERHSCEQLPPAR